MVIGMLNLVESFFNEPRSNLSCKVFDTLQQAKDAVEKCYKPISNNPIK
jgi:hypothetical protein